MASSSHTKWGSGPFGDWTQSGHGTQLDRVKYLRCSYAEKDEANGLGALWDPGQKKAYVPAGEYLEPFERWIDGGIDAVQGTPITPLNAKRSELRNKGCEDFIFVDWLDSYLSGDEARHWPEYCPAWWEGHCMSKACSRKHAYPPTWSARQRRYIIKRQWTGRHFDFPYLPASTSGVGQSAAVGSATNGSSWAGASAGHSGSSAFNSGGGAGGSSSPASASVASSSSVPTPSAPSSSPASPVARAPYSTLRTVLDHQVYLNVPFNENKDAKGLGARWREAPHFAWGVPAGLPLELFDRWLEGGVAAYRGQPMSQEQLRLTTSPHSESCGLDVSGCQCSNENCECSHDRHHLRKFCNDYIDTGSCEWGNHCRYRHGYPSFWNEQQKEFVDNRHDQWLVSEQVGLYMESLGEEDMQAIENNPACQQTMQGVHSYFDDYEGELEADDELRARLVLESGKYEQDPYYDAEPWEVDPMVLVVRAAAPAGQSTSEASSTSMQQASAAVKEAKSNPSMTGRPGIKQGASVPSVSLHHHGALDAPRAGHKRKSSSHERTYAAGVGTSTSEAAADDYGLGSARKKAKQQS